MVRPISDFGYKEYIGDGAYVDFDGYSLVLTAEDGINVTNEVYLDPIVYATLVRYVERLKSGMIVKKENNK